MIGETLGSYKILSELGAGGMGAVYAAEHTLIGRQAAVKLLLPALSKDKQLVDRFFNEARAAAMIKHPGIVDVFDFGYAEDGSAYLIMELLDGEALTDRIERGSMEEAEILRIGRQVASTLADVHETDIIHRDLKPDNIFVVPDSEVPGGERSKVLDFGIAKLSGNRAPGTSKTQTGQVMGSPLYMSPEQCRGAGEVDNRTDIYSLGCILFEMVCGQPVFDGEGVGEILGKQIYEAPIEPHTLNPAVSPQLEAIILRALAKDPDERFASMHELVLALDQAAGAPSTRDVPVDAIYSEDSVADTVAPSSATPKLADKKVLTTLGTAATEMPTPELEQAPAAKASRGRYVAVAVALLAASAGAYALVGRGEGPATTAATSLSAAAEVPTATEAETTEPAEEPPAEPTSEPAARVTVKLESQPTGAQVVRVSTGEKLGRTPFEQEFDQADADLTVVLKLAGYNPREVVVPLKDDYRDTLTLFKAGAAAPQPPATTTAPTAPSKPDPPATENTAETEKPWDETEKVTF